MSTDDFSETCTLVWLDKRDFCPMAEMSPRTAHRMAKAGRIPGTEGRGEGYYADPWPIALTPRLESFIQNRLETLRRQRVMAERKAQAEATGASLSPVSTIVNGADAVRLGLWTMAERRTIDRLSKRDLQRLEKALREPSRSLFDLHNAVQSRMVAAGITPLG